MPNSIPGKTAPIRHWKEWTDPPMKQNETHSNLLSFPCWPALLIGTSVALVSPGPFVNGFWGSALIAAVSVFLLLVTWRWAGTRPRHGHPAGRWPTCCAWRVGDRHEPGCCPPTAMTNPPRMPGTSSMTPPSVTGRPGNWPNPTR